MLPFRFRQSVELLVYLPLVKQMPAGHEPHFLFRPVQKCDSVKDKTGKDLLIRCILTACQFFFRLGLDISFCTFNKGIHDGVPSLHASDLIGKVVQILFHICIGGVILCGKHALVISVSIEEALSTSSLYSPKVYNVFKKRPFVFPG